MRWFNHATPAAARQKSCKDKKRETGEREEEGFVRFAVVHFGSRHGGRASSAFCPKNTQLMFSDTIHLANLCIIQFFTSVPFSHSQPPPAQSFNNDLEDNFLECFHRFSCSAWFCQSLWFTVWKNLGAVHLSVYGQLWKNQIFSLTLLGFPSVLTKQAVKQNRAHQQNIHRQIDG